MIKIVYDKPEMAVTVCGHALFAAAGKDIICAGVSALTDAMFRRVQGRMCWQPAYGINRDRAVFYVRLTPKSRHEEQTAREMLETICGGYELIARQFPQNVSYEVR